MTNRMNRRQFLRIVGISGAAGVLMKAGWDRVLAPDVEGGLTRVMETRLLMGTVVNLTLLTPDPAAGRAAITACLDHMAGLEAVMSRHRADSQLARLNRAGRLDDADPHLLHVLAEADHLSRLTGGAFDVTVKPLVDCYQTATQDGGALPTESAIQQARDFVDYRAVNITGRTIMLERPGMALTLDGIAKGYIVDQGMALLRRHGFTRLMVEAGGDLCASGDGPAAAPWRIGITPPRPAEADWLAVFSVTNQAAATSGDYMQPYNATMTAHHIIDPRTGHSSPELASATVVAPSGMAADGLATACMVLGLDASQQVIAALPGHEAYLVTKGQRIWRSPGFNAG